MNDGKIRFEQLANNGSEIKEGEQVVTSHISSKYLQGILICLLYTSNDILDLSREIKNTSQQSENNLKETITNLSHDIRTPLTSLDGYFQLLSQSESEEEQQHYIAVIQSRIISLKDMLEELFTYTKLQNESYEIALEPVDFGKCVFDTVFSFYDEFQKKGIKPEIDFCEGHFSILGNAEAVRRALQNIIKNALEHGKKEITLNLYKDKNEIVFRCSNDVENPSEVDIHEVFSRFYKADSARSNISTGLGLSIAKELIEDVYKRQQHCTASDFLQSSVSSFKADLCKSV